MEIYFLCTALQEQIIKHIHNRRIVDITNYLDKFL